MVSITDEKLMAYVDGELDDTEAKKIREAVESDDAVRRRMEVFRQTSDMLQEVYDDPIKEAVPDRLINTIMNYRTAESARTLNRFKIPSLMERLSIFSAMSPGLKPAFALVAIVAMMIGGGIVQLAHTVNERDQQQVVMSLNGDGFNRGMETTLSGQPFRVVGQGIEITPVATFTDPSGRYCRQYEISANPGGSMPVSQGIACRTDTGTWSTIVSVHPSPVSVSDGSGPGYTPAGEPDLMDVIFPRIMATPPVSLEKETELINRLWAKQRSPE